MPACNSPIAEPANGYVGDAFGSTGTAIGPFHFLCTSEQHAGSNPGDAFYRFVLKGVTYTVLSVADCPVVGSGLAIGRVRERMPGWHAIARGLPADGTALKVAGRGRFSSVTPGNVGDSTINGLAPTWSFAGVKWGTASAYHLPTHFPGYIFGGSNQDSEVFWKYRAPGDGGAASELAIAKNDSGAGIFVTVGSDLRLVAVGAYSSLGTLSPSGYYDYWDPAQENSPIPGAPPPSPFSTYSGGLRVDTLLDWIEATMSSKQAFAPQAFVPQAFAPAAFRGVGTAAPAGSKGVPIPALPRPSVPSAPGAAGIGMRRSSGGSGGGTRSVRIGGRR